MVGTAILWILGEIVPDFEVDGTVSALFGALAVMGTTWVFGSLAIWIFPPVRAFLERVFSATLEFLER